MTNLSYLNLDLFGNEIGANSQAVKDLSEIFKPLSLLRTLILGLNNNQMGANQENMKFVI